MPRNLDRISEESRRSSARAESSAGDFARRRIDGYLRHNWIPLAVAGVLSAVFALAVWLVAPGTPGARGFSAGVILAAGIGSLYHFTILGSGAAGSRMGQLAEEWTSSELRRLDKDGWKTLDHLIMRPPGDIDHVAVGPDGILVVETKWTSAAQNLSQDSSWLNEAAGRARRNERDVAEHLDLGADRDVRITALIVVWGPQISQDDDGPQVGPQGVMVLAGAHLTTVLGDLGDPYLDDGEIERIYTELAQQVDGTDGWTATDREGSRRMIPETARDWTLQVGAATASFTASMVALNLGKLAVVAVAVLIAVGLVALSRKRLRLLGTSWLVGIVGAAATISIVMLMLTLGWGVA